MADSFERRPQENARCVSDDDDNYSDFNRFLSTFLKPRGVVLDGTASMNEDDVLCGRGSEGYDFKGNVRFRALLQDFRLAYHLAEHRAKRNVAWEAVKAVQRRGGRFLQLNEEDWSLHEVEDLTVLKKAQRELGSNKVASNWMLPFKELEGCENFDFDSQASREVKLFWNLEPLKVDSGIGAGNDPASTKATPTTARMDSAFGEPSHLVVPMAAVVEGVGSKSPATIKSAPVATGTATPTMLQWTIGSMCHPVDKQICRFEGCTNEARRRGLCRKHGRKTDKPIATCHFEGCRNKVVNKGLCLRHGANKSTCKHDGCNNYAVRRGVCKMHGAQTIRKRCRHEGCNNFAQRRGVCKSHGANK